MTQPVFKLFAGCVPVRGARRSTLCDLQRHTYRLIPNALYEILTEHADRPADEIRAAFGGDPDGVIDQYFAFLVDEEFGFWCDDPAAFPPLDQSWETPERVTNAIVDVGDGSRHDWRRIVGQLDELGCRALQLRFFRSAPPAEVHEAVGAASRSRLRSVEVILKHGPEWSDHELRELCRVHPRLTALFIHSAPARRQEHANQGTVPISFWTQPVESAAHCGEVHPAYFVTGLASFTEARHFNSCLNRKISVDENGEIRNCPAMPVSFGNVRDTSLHSAVMQSEFREVWAINKDQVETCSECEFRYVCTDCRAFVRDPGNRLSKPSKCSYDPASASWGTPAPARAAGG